MSSKELKEIGTSLTPAQLEVIKQKQITGSFLPAKLIKLLKKVSLYDGVNDKLRNKFRKRSQILFMVCIPIFMIMIFATVIAESGIPFIIGLVLIVTLVIIGLYYNTEKNKRSKADLNNDIREFLFPFAALMKEEVLSNSKIQLEVDGRDPFDKSFFVKEVPRTERYGRAYKHYQQLWLKGSLTFFDNTKLFFEGEKFASAIKVRKRSASGKIKIKNKEKFKGIARLKMVVPKENYTLSGKNMPYITAVDAGEAIIVKGKYKYKAQSVAPMPVHEFLNVIHHMYATVKPVA